MPVRPLKLTNLTPGTVATFDLLVSGEWVEHRTIIDRAAPVCVARERDASLRNGHRVRRKWLAKGHTLSDEELIESGARDLVRNRLAIAVRSGRIERDGTLLRMVPETISEWSALRSTRGPELVAGPAEVQPGEEAPQPPLAEPRALPDRTTTPPHTHTAGGPGAGAGRASAPSTHRARRSDEVRLFGGIPEDEGWLAAPLTTFARVHWRTKYRDIELGELAKALPPDVQVSFDDAEGLYRVDCAPGSEVTVRELVRSWCAAQDVEIKSLRAEPQTRTRRVEDLDPAYLADLCSFYAVYANGRLRRHISTLQYHYSDPDDLKQQVACWILRAVRTFDNTKSVPFGAYLSAQLSSWVHDLNRSKYGRGATDAERDIHRVTRDFLAEHGRRPTDVEAAALLGQSVDSYRKNARLVASLQGMRNAASLDGGEDDHEVQLTDPEDAETQLLIDDRNAHLSRVLLTSCEVEPDGHARSRLSKQPNVLGLVAWYEKIWGSGTKGDLASSLNTSMRNLNVYADRVEARMRERQDDFTTR